VTACTDAETGTFRAVDRGELIVSLNAVVVGPCRGLAQGRVPAERAQWTGHRCRLSQHVGRETTAGP